MVHIEPVPLLPAINVSNQEQAAQFDIDTNGVAAREGLIDRRRLNVIGESNSDDPIDFVNLSVSSVDILRHFRLQLDDMVGVCKGDVLLGVESESTQTEAPS